MEIEDSGEQGEEEEDYHAEERFPRSGIPSF